MQFSDFLKRGCYSLFFFACSFDVFAVETLLSEPQAQQWKALIHYRNDQFFINSPSFLFSGSSPEEELSATIDRFRSNQDSICKFPARYKFLAGTRYATSLPSFPECKAFKTYKTKAPIDSLSVVFASENLKSPSSMMGHIMLATEGTREDGYVARHSVSFFTDLGGLNIPKIIWGTLINGQQGYFLLKPLKKHYQFYHGQENRNVWQYQLALDDQSKELIADHFWELKDANIPYLFTSHNCATLVLDILRIADQKLEVAHWASPADVVKSLDTRGLIDKTVLMPSKNWQVKMLSEQLPGSTVQAMSKYFKGEQQAFDTSEMSSKQRYIANSLMSASIDYLQSQQVLIPDNVKQPEELSGFSIDLQEYKSPLNTPADSQLSISYLNRDSTEYIAYGWLPAAHGIEDNNQQYFGETELKLIDIELLQELTTGSVSIDRVQLYSSRALINRDPITGGISGGFRLGYYPAFDESFKNEHVIELEAGAGFSKTLTSDLQYYWLANIGVNDSRDGNFYLQPEFGLTFYQVLNMKSWLRYIPRFQQARSTLHQWRLTHSIDFDSWAMMFHIEHVENKLDSRDQWRLQFKKYY